MAKTYFVDVANSLDSKKRKSKIHTVYDGERCFKVKKLTDLKDADETYIDALLPSIYGELYELLESGVRVYLLRSIKILKEKRAEDNLKKTDENDAMVLSKISKEYFRELAIEEVRVKKEMFPLISKYKMLSKEIKTLKQCIETAPEYSEDIKILIKTIEKVRVTVERDIINKLRENPVYWNTYSKALEILKLKNSTSIAILVVILPLHLSIQKLKAYLGFTPQSRKNQNYNHNLRQILSSLADTIYKNYYRLQRRGGIYQYINEKSGDGKEKMLYKIQLKILKTLKKVYNEVNKSTNKPTGL